MVKGIKLVLFAVLVLIFLGVFVYFIFYSDNKLVGEYDEETKVNGEVGRDEAADEIGESENLFGEDFGSTPGSGGSEGGGRGGGGASGEGFGSDENAWVNPYILLVKPEEILSVDGFINYIHSDSVSLGIINEIGEEVEVLIRLTNCFPELGGVLAINESREFVFTCSNSGLFKGDLFITYSFGGNDPITIFGEVVGSVG